MALTSTTRLGIPSKRFPLAVFDALGLGLAMAALYKHLNATHFPFLVILLGISISVWIFFLTTQKSILKHPYSGERFLLMPIVSMLIALIIFSVAPVYYSLLSLLTFASIWTISIVAVRMVYQKSHAPVHVLCIQSLGQFSILKHVSGVHISTLQAPPESMTDWDAAVIDPGVAYSREWLDWLTQATRAGLPLVSAPLAVEALTDRLPTNLSNTFWVSDVLRTPRLYAWVKRVLDLGAIIVLLPVLLPVALLVALVVFFDGGRPVLFCQQRMGKDGQPFTLFKFRSMRPDAEKNGALFASQHDTRVTRVGNFLRKYRLDELPQFWNVFRNQMSIIGPRPEQVSFAREFSESIPLYDARHNVKPGITGWAQVRQGYAAGSDETSTKLSYDLYYVKNMSFFLDIKIVVLTIKTILTGFGSR
jgi:lipopolysaccharide/colanic/teichoic acid biosynthesis glycosyltransferase